jgi:hypothetical protein
MTEIIINPVIERFLSPVTEDSSATEIKER